MLETIRDTDPDESAAPKATPGVVVAFSNAAAAMIPIAAESKEILLGREIPALSADTKMSRQHAALRLARGKLQVRDLGSRNGTRVGGEQVEGTVTPQLPAVLRIGSTVAVLVSEIEAYLDGAVTTENDLVVGPALRAVFDEIGRAAKRSRTLLLHGETGVGKELAAREFHRAGEKSGGPFVAVNCAAIPSSLAERLFFGAVRGTYSGADKTADGYLQAASGGTLFLDEIGELDLTVQAKLLRVIESNEIMRLGATTPETVDVNFVGASWRNLREATEEGAFRSDLYFRIGRPEMRIPPLRARAIEIPWLVQEALREAQIQVRADFVEVAMCRHWPGNVRELLGEVTRAAEAVLARGGKELRAADLSAEAGRALASHDSGASAKGRTLPDDEAIISALGETDGNVSAAARKLGVHRNQIRRWLKKNGPIEPADSGA